MPGNAAESLLALPHSRPAEIKSMDERSVPLCAGPRAPFDATALIADETDIPDIY